MFELPPLCKLQEAIASPENPIGMRMRAAYFLRQAYENYSRNKDESNINEHRQDDKGGLCIAKEQQQEEDAKTAMQEGHVDGDGINESDDGENEVDQIVLNTLSRGLEDERHGSLLRHEFAYVMGQIRDKRSCATLEKILLNQDDCVMVRHECGEALGAISSTSSIPILQKAIEQNPNKPEISQTCSLAISFIEWKINGGTEGDADQPMVCACMLNPYSSIDPAPPHPNHVSLSTKEIGRILHDASNPLFDRYRAMFSLRNRGTKECVDELGLALVEDGSSALLRHEIAYVLGQMQSPDSIDALKTSLQRKDEHVMVRHESAEALGAIEERWDEVEAVLKLFSDDDDIVVRESCIVALDAADYWGRSTCSETTVITDTDKVHDKDRTSFAQQKAQVVH